MVLPRLYNATSKAAFTAAKSQLIFNRGLATTPLATGKVRYVFILCFHLETALQMGMSN